MIHKLAPPYTECTEQQKKEANHSRRVDGNFKKRGNFHMRLVLGTWSRVNLYTPSQNLNSLCKGINQIQSHNLSRRSQHSVLSRLQSWIWLPLWEPWAEIMVHGYGAGGAVVCKGPLTAHSAPASTCSHLSTTSSNNNTKLLCILPYSLYILSLASFYALS